jgi:hypothetical protein
MPEFNQEVVGRIQAWVAHSVGDRKHLLSAWTRRAWELDQRELTLNESTMREAVDSLGRLTVRDKCDQLLNYVVSVAEREIVTEFAFRRLDKK